jgi:hypothetical protein
MGVREGLDPDTRCGRRRIERALLGGDIPREARLVKKKTLEKSGRICRWRYAPME